MKKIILAFTAIATLAVPAVSMANVSVDANGTGFVGKGDVQTALGYGSGGSHVPVRERCQDLHGRGMHER
jgi:hypothetical protein